MDNVVEHPIVESSLYINNKKFLALNVEKIAVGVENENRTEILKDEATGLNYARNAVEAQEVYNSQKQKFSNWFVLDLECGSRGWFPGSVIKGNIINETEIHSEPNEESSVIKTITASTVTVLNIRDINDSPSTEGWYKIKFDVTGYVPVSSVSGLKYSNPN